MPTMSDPRALHASAIVIDAVCPLLQQRRYLDWYMAGGVTVAAPTVASSEGAGAALRTIAGWKRAIADDPRLMQVRAATDISAAKAAGRLGILLHFQGADPIEDDLDLVHAYKDLGVGVIQLCYNVKNRVGDGADERTDAGLSYFGVDLVKRLNAARVVVDCAHTGLRTSLDAIATSAAPVVISHGNPRALHESRRNLPDELIRAIAGSGGVIGAVGFPGFVGPEQRPTLDRFIDHIAYMADLVGIDHVGLGIDYYLGQHPVTPEDEARRQYEAWIASGRWRPGTYPPPPHHYPEGIATPRELPALTARLVARGFAAEDVRKVLGENWRNVWRAVWGA
jgi:membrane dipeptidase